MEETGGTAVVVTKVELLPVAGDLTMGIIDTDDDKRQTASEEDSSSEEGSDTSGHEDSVTEEIEQPSLEGKETVLDSLSGEADVHPEGSKSTCKVVPKWTLRDTVNKSTGAE